MNLISDIEEKKSEILLSQFKVHEKPRCQGVHKKKKGWANHFNTEKKNYHSPYGGRNNTLFHHLTPEAPQLHTDAGHHSPQACRHTSIPEMLVM